ncbi:uncharacterized protein LOC134201161 [Bombyx mori]|uniref:uncharacterized protein LOC134201161 n=1 Tax=Bombyx mori TaxID=7091 RepID=UPI002ED0E344
MLEADRGTQGMKFRALSTEQLPYSRSSDRYPRALTFQPCLRQQQKKTNFSEIKNKPDRGTSNLERLVVTGKIEEKRPRGRDPKRWSAIKRRNWGYLSATHFTKLQNGIDGDSQLMESDGITILCSEGPIEERER